MSNKKPYLVIVTLLAGILFSAAIWPRSETVGRVVESDAAAASPSNATAVERTSVAPGRVVALTDRDLSEAANLRYEFIDGSYNVVTMFNPDGTFTTELAQGEDVCMSAYEVETNVMLGYCTGPEGVDAFRWSNVPSSGYESKKYFQAMAFASVPPFLGAAGLGGNGNNRGLVQSSARAKAREGAPVDFSIVADGASGLLVDSGTPEVQVTKMLSAPGDLGQKAALRKVRRSVKSAETIQEEDWGFEQVSSLEAAERRASYSVPRLDLPDEYQLRDIFYASEARLPGSDGNPPSVDIVVQVYTHGVRELVVTSRALNPRPALETRSEVVSRPDDDPASWVNDPIDFAGEGYPLGDQGWSELVQTPYLPTHFWGIENDAVVVVEGYLLPPAVLEEIRRALVE